MFWLLRSKGLVIVYIYSRSKAIHVSFHNFYRINCVNSSLIKGYSHAAFIFTLMFCFYIVRYSYIVFKYLEILETLGYGSRSKHYIACDSIEKQFRNIFIYEQPTCSFITCYKSMALGHIIIWNWKIPLETAQLSHILFIKHICNSIENSFSISYYVKDTLKITISAESK